MSKKSEKPPHISQQDWDDADIPEWTVEDFARAKPFSEAFPEQYSAWKQRGRPRSESPKIRIGFRLAADVVAGDATLRAVQAHSEGITPSKV